MKALKITAAMLLLLGLALVAWLWTPDRDVAVLQSRYLASPTDLREVAGTRLHVRDTGRRDGPAVLMLHGFGASLHTWEPWAQALGDAYRVVRFDLPGSGLSPPDPTGDYTDARSTVLINAVLDHLGIERAHLVGSSMGGRMVWFHAAQHPQRVRKLVLVSPDGFASPGFEYGRRAEVGAGARLMRHVLPKAAVRMGLAPAYVNQDVLTDDLLTRYHDLMLAPGARDALIERLTQVVRTDPVPFLRRIEAPTLLLWGEQDAMIPVAHADDYLRALPRATKVVLPGIGHLPQEEDPAGSLVPVRAFFDE